MFSRLPARLTAALVSGLLVVGALGATPAFAEDAVAEPTPVSVAPVEEAAPEAVAPLPEPSSPVEPTATPAPVAAEGFDLIELTGVVAELSEDGSKDSDVKLFHVDNRGYLSINFAHAPLDVTLFAGAITVTLAVPKSLDLGSTTEERFTSLEHYSVFDTALDVVTFEAVDSTKNPQGMINVLPVSTAKHKIYAVPMTPADVAGSTITASQSSANILASVTASDAYWMEQSGGKIGFELAGVTGYYKSAFNCAFADPTNGGKLWTEGAIRAAADLNFKEGPNKHVVLFFPSTADCGAAIGLGTIGTTPNTGGRAWVIGTQTQNNLQTLAHELGHNLSFGHANWLDCATGQNPGTWSGCTSYEYGDVPDVMGYGSGDSIGGSVSSPNLIRSGVWGSDSYNVAPQGTTTYTINALSMNSGKRSIIVEQADGVNYFIEFRTTTGRDAGFTGEGCATNSGGQGWCAATNAGVRVLRLERRTFQFGSALVAFKGFYGDDTQLIGRTESGVRKVNYVQGETFSHQGIVVNVANISATSATVTVTRPSNTTAGGRMFMLKTSGNADGSKLYVGDTYTAMLSDDLQADSYSYAWYRSNKAISGATKQSYTITAADKGKGLRVRVTLKSKDGSSRVLYDPANTGSAGYGWILAGAMVQGSIKVDSSAPALKAVAENWDTPGTSLAYQWLRNGAAISGAKSVTYTPTAADNGKSLSVKVTGSKSGFNSASATSVPRNYTVLVTGGAVSVTGAAKVGATLTSTHNLTFAKQDPAGAIASPVISRQWLRNGAAIPSATGASYTLTPADYGKVISVRVSGTTPGWSFASATSAATIKIAKGTIAGSLAAATVSKNAATLELTAALPSGSVTEPSVTYAYQWYRGTAAISKATKVVYKLTSADVDKEIKVRVVVAKSNYDSATIFSVPRIYSLQTTGTATISGNQRVGQTLSVANLSYTTIDGAASPTRAYQWYRDGKAISGATTASFVTTATDFGKKLSVRVIATAPGYLPHTVTTAATGKLAAGIFTGSPTVAVTQAASVLTVSAPLPATIDETGYTLSYQWYRGAAKISKATKASYTLTSADFGSVISAKVSVAKSKYTTLVLSSSGKNYSLMPSTPTPVVVADAGGVKVGATFSLAARTYTANNVAVFPMVSYQWLRDGKAIPSATDPTYVSGDADKGKTISVTVTATFTNYLTSSSTSVATQKLGVNALAGHSAAATITKAAGVVTLTAVPGVTDTTAKFAYQWYRDGKAISKATKVTYTPGAADFAKVITVRVTATKADHTTVVTTSSAAPAFSVVPTGVPVISTSAPVIGSVLSVSLPSYSQSGVTPAYQWYAAGKAISGATNPTFTVLAAQKGKAITVRVIATKAGFLSSTLTSAATSKVIAS